MRRLLAVLVLGLILLLAATWWLAGRDETLRWVLDQAVVASDGQFSYRGASGNLLGTIELEHARFANPKFEADAERLSLDLSVPALLQRRLEIELLAADSLAVVLVPSEEPPQMPDSLVLPLALEVERLQIGRIDIRRGDASLTLRQLEASLASTGKVHDITLHGAATPWGQVAARVSLEGAHPFALEGRATLAPAADLHLLPPLELKASGSLANLSAHVAAQAAWLKAELDAEVLPFEALPLRQLQARLDRLELRHIDASWPEAVLAGQLTAAQTGDSRFNGRASLRNAVPGTLGEDRLPLTSLDSAFDADLQRLELDDLRLGLRLGAPLTGRARLSRDGVSAQLDTTALDLKAFHDNLAPTRLAGGLTIDASGAAQRLQAQLRDARQHYTVDATREGERITVQRARLRNGSSVVELQGGLTASAGWPFQAQARLVQFDPAAFGDFPSARLNATVSGRGNLRPDWSGRFEAVITDSLFERRPLSGRVQAQLSPQRVHDSRGDLSWGRNQVVFHGTLGAAGDRLELERIKLDVASFDQGWSGLATGSATLAGKLRYPAVTLRMTATDLKGPDDLVMGQAEVSAEIAPTLDAPLAIKAQIAGLRMASIAVDRAFLAVDGQGSKHELKLTVAGKDLVFETGLAGGFDRDFAWQGEIRRFLMEQPQVLKLEAPARLALSRTGLQLGKARLLSDEALIQIDRLALDAAGLRTAGQFNGVPAALLGLPLRRSVRSEALLGGKWQIDATDRLNGSLEIHHESGVWAVDAPVGLAVRPTRGQMQIVARDNRVSLDADVALRDGSKVDLELATELSRRGQFWTLPGDAPLTLKARGNVESLERWGSLLHRDIALAGKLSLDIAAKGSMNQPAVSGRIEGRDIDIRHFPSGVSLSDGTLEARLDGDRIYIDGFGLRAGEGTLNIDGVARLGEHPDLRLNFRGQRLALMERRDLDLDTDVEGELALDRELAALKARVTVNRGMFILGDSYAPTLSPDVRIRGRTPKPEASQRQLGLALDVSIDLGDDFRVRSSERGQLLGGRLPFQTSGLNTRITGQVRMRGDRGENVRADGEIRVVGGSYFLLGQRLDIERGILRFDGPLQNPALDISTVRENPRIRVGLNITGNAENPRARLFSEPEVPDQEKLSWLLLGRGGQPVDTSLNSITGTTQGFISSFGMQVSDRLYVAFGQSATGTENFVSFYSNLTDRLSIEARTGDENALQLFYTFSLGKRE
jgi:translocation and assembly module TamB